MTARSLSSAYLPFITIVGAVVNIIANYLLIPSMGMIGAAWATFFAYLGMAIAAYIVVQRVYPVHYEWNRILKIFLSLSLVLVIYYALVLPLGSSMVRFPAKLALAGFFILLMFVLKFFRTTEVRLLRKIFQKEVSTSPPAVDQPVD